MENLTSDQRLAMTSGAAMWATVGYPNHGIASLTMGDGPMGIAGGRVDERDVALLTPCGTALGASWDLDLCTRIGMLVGGEAVRCGVDMVLAPNVNLARSPLAGRAFEYFSEDPLLAGVLGAAWATGLQTTGTAAVVKHIVCNDSETDRDTMNAVVDERTLREVYLLPFELCAQAGVGGMLTAYNKLNGEWCSEHHYVLTRIVKQEWGFDGIVMSDWFGTHSSSGALNGGLDLEMPGPARFLGAKAADAVARGIIDLGRVDDAAGRLAHAAQRFSREKSRPIVEDDAKALLVEAAAAGFVLLKNEGNLLPLEVGADKRIAVIGPNATAPCYQGGTFAKIAVAPDALRPLEAIEAIFGSEVRIDHEAGVDPQPRLPTMDVRPSRDIGDGCVAGMTIDYYDGQGEGAVLRTSETRDTNSLVWFMGVHDDVVTLSQPGRITASGVFEARTGGDHIFYLGATGRTRLRIDGREIIVRDEAIPPADVMGTLKGGDADSASLELHAGQKVLVEVDFEFTPARVQGLWYGIRRPDTPEAMLERAVALAREADAVVLIVGETSDASVESKDRDDTRLPPEQVRLIEAVTQANRRTVVVANVGHAFDTSWDSHVAALLVTWYPGEGFGEALAQVLSGQREPGGRLPVSIAYDESDYPAFALTPGPSGDLSYSEGTLIGYRGMSRPRYAFGAGLGYAHVEFVSAALSSQIDPVRVDVVVHNRSARAGSEVIQVYRREPELALAGFAKVHLASGERRTVGVNIPRRSLQTWQDGWNDINEPCLFVGRSAVDVAISLQ
ncbi:beta-glucosidase (plasmid) [Novosphingobium sp. P6W]|nr:beta-glucosidase [Novosphingobium sp. P6W]